jgi:hypothetical protein
MLSSPFGFIRQTSPHAPHSFTGDSEAVKPCECMSISTFVLSPQFGHFIEASFFGCVLLGKFYTTLYYYKF